MNPISATLSLMVVTLIVALPRPGAVLPIVIATDYVTRSMTLDVGGIHLTLLHITIVAGLLRALMRGETIANGIIPLDRWVATTGVVLFATGFAHPAEGAAYRAGIVVTQLGAYWLCRIFIRDNRDIENVMAMACLAVLPLALLMLLEKTLAENFFAVVGGSSDVILREGTQHVRARGPFAHAILAGTVGATCFGMAIAVWKRHVGAALTGLFASVAIVISAASSGPVLMLLSIVLACIFYRFRGALKAVRWLAVLALIALHFLMNDPVYFLAAKIDVAGGSQGWYRAQLIRSSLQHLNEWWLLGTDYTRDWMPTGTHADDTSADITNHFLQMGVWGGLPLMLLFCCTLLSAFRTVGRSLQLSKRERAPPHSFLTWTLGAILFGHVLNMMSISLFDQSVVYLYLVLALIGSTSTAKANSTAQPANADAGAPRPTVRCDDIAVPQRTTASHRVRNA